MQQPWESGLFICLHFEPLQKQLNKGEKTMWRRAISGLLILGLVSGGVPGVGYADVPVVNQRQQDPSVITDTMTIAQAQQPASLPLEMQIVQQVMNQPPAAAVNTPAPAPILALPPQPEAAPAPAADHTGPVLRDTAGNPLSVGNVSRLQELLGDSSVLPPPLKEPLSALIFADNPPDSGAAVGGRAEGLLGDYNDYNSLALRYVSDFYNQNQDLNRSYANNAARQMLGALDQEAPVILEIFRILGIHSTVVHGLDEVMGAVSRFVDGLGLSGIVQTARRVIVGVVDRFVPNPRLYREDANGTPLNSGGLPSSHGNWVVWHFKQGYTAVTGRPMDSGNIFKALYDLVPRQDGSWLSPPEAALALIRAGFVNILNLSFLNTSREYFNRRRIGDVWASAGRWASQRGIFVFGGAGNNDARQGYDLDREIPSPARYGISVSTKFQGRGFFRNSHLADLAVDRTLLPFNPGTSFATPYAAGMAAALLQSTPYSLTRAALITQLRVLGLAPPPAPAPARTQTGTVSAAAPKL